LIEQPAFVAAAIPQARGHTLYGDLRIDANAAAGQQPLTLTVSLVTISGGGLYGPNSVIGRQQVPPNGRYQFLDVPNGEYELVIERESVEVGRMRMMIQERRFTDIRRDITLQWQPGPTSQAAGKPGTVLAADAYKRGAATSGQFEKAAQAIKMEDNRKAAELLQQVIAADPMDFEAWTELGTVQFKQGRMSEAEESYKRALEKRPSYLVAQLNLGKLYLAQKKNEEAVQMLSRAVESRPDSADAQLYLGEAYLQVKKGSKAVGCLNEAIRLDPIGKAEAHLRLATLYNAAGMKDKAVAEYEQFLAKRPDYAEKEKLLQYIKQNKKP
jgi:Tfp pilus assembly protein PilF